jgi:hypothetical protein
VNLQQDSAWKKKLFVIGDWQPAEESGCVLSRTVTVDADEEEEVVLASR